MFVEYDILDAFIWWQNC